MPEGEPGAVDLAGPAEGVRPDPRLVTHSTASPSVVRTSTHVVPPLVEWLDLRQSISTPDQPAVVSRSATATSTHVVPPLFE